MQWYVDSVDRINMTTMYSEARTQTGQGVGATIAVSLGGKADPDLGGAPLLIEDAYVKALTDGRFTLERW